ncbi:MAG: DUF1016 domain-containing protein [Puniceicoccales bacterium]|nr:DUF1016 domain-containing protein [Puniceicoccales bacterium]
MPKNNFVKYNSFIDENFTNKPYTNKILELTTESDNPPIGILLYADKSDTLVKYTLPENNEQIFAAKYLPYMPTKEELRHELNLGDYEKIGE